MQAVAAATRRCKLTIQALHASRAGFPLVSVCCVQIRQRNRQPLALAAINRFYSTGQDNMKRVLVWAVYLVGTLSIGYLAIYAYMAFTRPQIRPGAPIRIYEREDAPRHSSAHRLIVSSMPSSRDSLPIPPA